MRKILILPIFAVLAFVLSFSVQDAHALTLEMDKTDSNGVCLNDLGGTFDSTTSTCTISGSALNFVTVQIDSGVTVLIEGGGGIINQINGIIDNLGTITVNSGDFSNIGPIATVNNSGTINVNSGSNFGGGGPIINSGTMNINSGGNFDAAGTVNNSGIIDINSGKMESSGTVNNSGSLNNSGTMDNSATFNNFASIDNTGVITNHAGGIMTNNHSGTISNQGTITNECGAIFTNDGTLTGNPVILCGTTTVLSSLQNPSTVGQSVTITANITPSTATGSVIFTVDGSPGSPVTLSGGNAVLVTSSLAMGAHTITATYSGNANYGPSTSSPFTQTVNKLDTVISLSSSDNLSTIGQPVNFTAIITPSSTTGTVTFNDSDTIIGTSTVANGVASIVTSSLSVGIHHMTAKYSGDTNDQPSTSSVLDQTINQIPTTTTLSSSQNPSLIDQSVTFTTTILPNTATGTVTFNDGATELGSSPVSSGTATFTTSSLSGGLHSIMAQYSGDSTFGPSNSTVLIQTVILSTSGKVTGGGHVGKDQDFGFEVSSKDGKTFKGHLEYHDKTAHIDLESVNMTQLFVDSSMTKATFAGQATTDNDHHGDDKKNTGPTLGFLVNVTDSDKTGNPDTLSITVTNGTGNVTYQNSGTVKGHIEIHNIDTDDNGSHNDNNNHEKNSK